MDNVLNVLANVTTMSPVPDTGVLEGNDIRGDQDHQAETSDTLASRSWKSSIQTFACDFDSVSSPGYQPQRRRHSCLNFSRSSGVIDAIRSSSRCFQ